MNISRTGRVAGAIHYIYSLLKDKELPVFTLVLLYYCVLFFTWSNISFLLVLLCFMYVLYRTTGKPETALFIALIATLPFSQGKSIALSVIDRNQVLLPVTNPFMYFVGIRFSDILLLGAWYYMLSRHFLFRPSKDFIRVSFVFAAFIVFCVVTSGYSEYPVVAFVSSLQFFRLFAVFLLTQYMRFNNRYIGQIVSAGLLFEGMFGVLQFINHGALGTYLETIPAAYGIGKIAWEQPGLIRVSGSFADPDIYATYLLMGIAIVSSMLPKLDGVFKNVVLFAVAAACVGIIVAGNRIAYVFLVFYFVLYCRDKIRRNIIVHFIKERMLWLLPGAAITVYYLSIRLTKISELFSSTGSATFRLQMIVSSIRLGTEYIFGVGLGLSPVYLATKELIGRPIYSTDYPHNLFMELFAETGLIGLLLICAFMYLFIRPVILNNAGTQQKPYFFASLMFFAASMVYPLTFDAMEILSVAVLWMGLAYSIEKPGGNRHAP